MSLETRLYQTNTNENFFNRFKDLSIRLTELGNLFQNSDATISNTEVVSWDRESDDVLEEVESLIQEASERIYRVK